MRRAMHLTMTKAPTPRLYFMALQKPKSLASSPHLKAKGGDGKPLRCTDDPNNANYYTVKVRRVWLFGYTYGIREYNLCKVYGS